MKRKWFAALLILCVLLGGCDLAAIEEAARQELAHMLTDPAEAVEPFFGFSEKDVEKISLLERLEPAQLENYVSEYSSYNTYTYFGSLNDTEQRLYHAYEYALDHGYPYIWMDERLIENMERTGFEVLQFLALDSAMVEQNIGQSTQEYTITHSLLNVETSKEAYTVVFIEHFASERLQHKQEAIAKACQIVDRMPHELTQREKAEYFYDYLGENVVYEGEIPAEEYLYSALCQGKTNCDGYANAFSVLCALAEIPCVEINSDTPPEEEGHTWNAVYLEDQWVHVDATGAADDVKSECENRRLCRVYFGFSDALLEDTVKYDALLPECPQGLMPVLHIPSGEVEDFNGKVKKAFRENDNKLAVILVDEGDLEEQITEELATKLDCDLYYTYYETAEGKMVYYLFNDE